MLYTIFDLFFQEIFLVEFLAQLFLINLGQGIFVEFLVFLIILYPSCVFPLSFLYPSCIIPVSFHHHSCIFPVSFLYPSCILQLSFNCILLLSNLYPSWYPSCILPVSFLILSVYPACCLCLSCILPESFLYPSCILPVSFLSFWPISSKDCL